jgi:hypothetical protein
MVREDVLEWCILQRGKDPSLPLSTGRRELPVPAAEAGEEDRRAALAERAANLKSACAECRGFISAALPSDLVLLRAVALPTLVESEIKGMVDLQVDKFSPFPLDSLVVSYEVLSRTSESSLVLIAAAQLSVADALEKRLREAGADVARVDVAVLGWCRLLKDAGEVPEKGRHLALLMDGSTPEIIVFEDGVPRIFRSLSGMDPAGGAAAAMEIAAEINFSLMSLEIEQVAEAECTLALWHAGPSPDALAMHLVNTTPYKVAVRPLGDLPPLPEGIARRAVQHEGGVDLTPPAWRETEKARGFKRRMWRIAAAVAALWVVTIAGFTGGLYVQKFRLQRLQAKLGALEKPAAEVREMQRRVRMVERYLSRQDSALEVMRELSALQPPGVNLSAFSYRKDEGVKISGEADAVTIIYDFKTALDASKQFRGVAIQGPRADRSGKQLFDMDIKLAGGGE